MSIVGQSRRRRQHFPTRVSATETVSEKRNMCRVRVGSLALRLRWHLGAPQRKSFLHIGRRILDLDIVTTNVLK